VFAVSFQALSCTWSRSRRASAAIFTALGVADIFVYFSGG